MEKLLIENKQKYLNDNYPFEGIPHLSDKKLCIHCNQTITVGDFKVYRDTTNDFEFICCPNAPDCDGTVIDWIDLG